ncbi:Acetyltransferase (GNAT) family protein [Fictibacillus solisalsi]|uniref:Acetyltransferase (GNAT) family protein n=1 Tax=Fictibacillus solisalsi TaxID=459525 RepID=A0A1H0A191_9BACL|nr:GNAT family N-acetyltransferase [Fictibacillus solisalsi]SDN26931.1 Acetyltransferase (GNAT) family protein [Fictibacillus solisalsi]
MNVVINMPLYHHEVPDLRELIGWPRRDKDYPVLLKRCNFWAGARNEANRLIAFGYVCGMGLEHGYMEDIMIHPNYQGQGLGAAVVKELLHESERFGLEIVTVTYANEHRAFYEACGFTHGAGGVWRAKVE